MPPPVFRFAPSPNGYLHLGHAYSALLNHDLARRTGGRFLLRIEDIDATRCRPEFEAAIYEDLAWLGISWETPVRRQSEHFARYREVVERLAGFGLIYPSFESRAELAWREDGAGPGGESGIVNAYPQAWGDVILARKETPTSYHLSVVIDDALQGVTDVVRGRDLFWSTSVHLLLQQLLGIPAPVYHHHRLLRDDTGQKLSKSTRATAIRELRRQGLT